MLQSCKAPNVLTDTVDTLRCRWQSSRISSRNPSSYGCCDYRPQVRDNLRLFPYTLFLRYPHRYKGGVEVRWMRRHSESHVRLISRSEKPCRSHANDSIEVLGGTILLEPLEDLTTLAVHHKSFQNLLSTCTYRSVLIVTGQNGPMIPCLDMATQALQSFTECNVLFRQCSGVSYPRRCYP